MLTLQLLQREELRKRATAFMGVSTSTDRTQEDILSTPQPGETLAKFFARSRTFLGSMLCACIHHLPRLQESTGHKRRTRERRPATEARSSDVTASSLLRKLSVCLFYALLPLTPQLTLRLLAEKYQPLLEEIARIQEQA